MQIFQTISKFTSHQTSTSEKSLRSLCSMYKFDVNFRIKSRNVNTQFSWLWRILKNIVFLLFHAMIFPDRFEKSGRLHFFFLRGTIVFHRIAKDWRAQIDAPGHHPLSSPKVAVQYTILKFLQKLTKIVTKKRIKKSKSVIFGTPFVTMVFLSKWCQKNIKISFANILLWMPPNASEFPKSILKSAKNESKKNKLLMHTSAHVTSTINKSRIF